MKKVILLMTAIISTMMLHARNKTNENMTTYHKVQVEDCKVFYREAGSKDKPAILLLHGFPSSSHMFR